MTIDATHTRTPTLPGRLGNPDSLLRTDPRADPRMIAAMAPFELDGAPPDGGVDATTPYEGLLEYCRLAEPAYEEMFSLMLADLDPIEGVTSRTETITGVDGNEIRLYIHQPTDLDRDVPCIVHTHGGGMVILTAAGPSFGLWRDSLAATGLVVVGVEFRNGGGSLGNHPFPAGLNDCASAVQWVHERRAELHTSHIVVSGESGGGNLSIATALKANKEGWVDQIAGVYAQCPYISGAYADPPADLASLVENDNYFLNVANMGALAKVYDPDGANATNPLAWPCHAGRDDLVGLPPHVISVNELDPLRDEGLAYFRVLLGADVSAVSRTVNGTCHAGDCIFAGAMPDVFDATIRDINGFAELADGELNQAAGRPTISESPAIARRGPGRVEGLRPMIVLTVLGAAAVAALVWSESRGDRVRLVAKPAASACFIAVALAAGATDSPYGRWVLVALLLSALGDVALLGRSSLAFMLGLGSFLLGHVAYVVAFTARGVEAPAAIVAAMAIAGPALLVIRWLWPHVPTQMKPPVAAYASIISLMVAMAIGTVAFDADGRILAAAVAFYCSDLAVARDRFVAPGAINRLWGLPLYYGAQFVFAWTVAA